MARLASLTALALGAMACGGRPPPATVPAAGGLAWTAVYGGAWVATCPLADGFAALRAGGLDRWVVSAAGPPKPTPPRALPWPGDGGPGVSLGCAAEGDRVVVHRLSGPPLAPEGEGWAEVDGGATPEAAPGWSGPIAGRAVRLARGGWALVRGGAPIAGRPTAGDFADATWDGEAGVLWAAGPTGLWRWRLDHPRLTFVPLPGGPRSLMRVWRDGPFLWVVDDSRTGLALDLSAGLPRLARPAGPVRLTGPDRMALVGGRRVAVALGGQALTVDGQSVDLGGRVTAFTPLGEAEVLLGVGSAIERWRIAGPPVRVARWQPGGRTGRLIVAGRRVFAVGGYGLLLGALD